MKRVFSLLVLALLFNSCDDGDLTLENIDFEDITTIQNCTEKDVLYKLKDKESLLLEIPETEFVNEPTTVGSPTLIDIDNSTYKVIYRFYNGSISSDNICSNIPPATPSATDQWTATSGKIQITTTTIKNTTSDNGTRITGYNHNIAFKDITFAKKNGNQIYATYPFGDYVVTTNQLSLTFNSQVNYCSADNQLYNYIVNDNEAMTIENIDPTLIQNVETPANSPRTGLLGTTTNKLLYRVYSGVLPTNSFCNTTTTTLPLLQEEWYGRNGDSTVSGIIEVTTVKSGVSAYKHTIIIKKATLIKDNSNFLLGDNFLYGELITF